MAIKIRPEFLDDRVLFHYLITQCLGVSDESGTIEVCHNNINKLPSLRPEDVPDNFGIEIFVIEKAGNAKIAFTTHFWQETSFGYMYQIYGPYHYYGRT